MTDKTSAQTTCCGSPLSCGAHDQDRYREGCIWPRPLKEAPISVACRVESAIRDVFEKRFLNQVLPYQQARELVWLERELVGEIVHRLKEISDVAI